jgi:hypothetical protein
MADISTWLVDARAALSDLRGSGSTDSAGVVMPLATALDTVAVLGQLSSPIVTTLTQFESNAGASDPSRMIDSALVVDGVYQMQILGAPPSTCSVREYVSGLPAENLVTGELSSWTRTVPPAVTSYEPYLVGTNSDQGQYLGFVRSMINSWQRAIDASARAIIATQSDLTQAMPELEAQNFWDACKDLATDLDVMGAQPLQTGSDRIKEALRSSADTTQRFVGEAAADISGEVGRAAGNVAQGFFSNVGVVGLAVAGLAVYLVVK